MSTQKPRPRLPVKGGQFHGVESHLTKVEKQRMTDMWLAARKVKAEKRRDAQPTFELLYLGLLGRVKNREAVQEELKELKKLLDRSSALMLEILEKSEKKTTSRK